MPRKANVTAEQEVIRRLENLENRVAAIEEHTTHNTRLKHDDHQVFIAKTFGRSARRAQVFLAANGDLSVNDIAEHLDMKRQNVTIELQFLERQGLVTVNTVGANSYWSKAQLDKTIGVSQTVMKRFGLTKDGLPKA